MSKQRKGRTERVEFNFTAKAQCPPGYFPGSEWLERRLEAARRRVELRAQPSGFLLHP